MMTSFRSAAAAVAGSQTDAGHASAMAGLALPPRLTCRDSQLPPFTEHQLLDQVADALTPAHGAISRRLLVDYYVSLKSNPFVVLTGPRGCGKTAFVQRFAEALVGPDSSQYALIPGASWPDQTGQDDYYRALHDRFTSWRFLEVLQEAAAPANQGKAYFVCFSRLHPDELAYYFTSLLHVLPGGIKRLNLPGFPLDHQPIVPPNLAISATVDVSAWGRNLNRNVLRHAGLIEFRTATATPGMLVSTPTPPPGYQRLWLRAAIHDQAAAQARLEQVLGPAEIGRLSCSPALARLLWRQGEVLTSQSLQELTRYVANSFDARGYGLFDPHNPLRNAQVAYDAQVVQRVLWRLCDSDDLELRNDLSAYLDALALDASHLAVA